MCLKVKEKASEQGCRIKISGGKYGHGKISDSLTRHDGLKIPGLGFGVWQIPPLHTAECVKTAIKAVRLVCLWE